MPDGKRLAELVSESRDGGGRSAPGFIPRLNGNYGTRGNLNFRLERALILDQQFELSSR